LAGVRQRARRRWEGDHLPDGWTRPLPPAPNPDRSRGLSRKSGELPDELRALADRFRSKAENGSGDDLPPDRSARFGAFRSLVRWHANPKSVRPWSRS
jgi:hypothetical protein